MNPVISILIFALQLTFCWSCSPESMQSGSATTVAADSNFISYSLKATLQHNRKAYTQGLVYWGDKLYESTGANQSWIAEVDLQSGTHKKKVVLKKKYFGEGITVLNNKVYQLTWKHNKGFIYRAGSFEALGTFSYGFDGWGITTDGQHLIISDGTHRLHYLDTLTFAVVKSLEVEQNGAAAKQLNELEYIDGYIYANQWETNYILKIDPANGTVVGKLDLSPIADKIKRDYPKANVLNGIAYNPKTEDILITGKRWPRAYIIKLD